MVLLTEDALDSVYKQIKHDSLAGICTVLVLVSNDVDALCACKILLEFFKADCVGHHVFPISGYDDLLYANTEFVEGNTALRTIIMLNCGGTADLKEFLTLTDDLTVYVFDSHRPFNLDSLFQSNQVVIVGGSVEEESVSIPEEVREAFSKIEKDVSDDEDASENGKENALSDSELDLDDESELKGGKRPADEDGYYRVQRKRMRDDENRREQIQNRRIIAEYYSVGSYFGQSVSCTAFLLSQMLGRVTDDTVWLGIVGLTHAYLGGKTSKASYAKFHTLFKDESERIGGADSSAEPFSSLEDPLTPILSAGEDLSTQKSEKAIVPLLNELRLMLFRHWSLWEALFFSPYVATTLGIWREKGRQKLTNFLATIGFPQTEYTQPYSDMSLPFCRSLAAKFQLKAPKYGLRNITFKSFYRQYGYRCKLSASDAAYSLAALLDGGLSWMKHLNTKEAQSSLVSGGIGATSSATFGKKQLGNESTVIEGVMGSLLHSNEQSVATGMKVGASAVKSQVDETYASWQNNAVSTGSDDGVHEVEIKAATDAAKRGNFYIAFDALSDVGLLQQGIQLAMHFQSEIVHTGISILDNRMIKTLKRFRLVVLGGRMNGSSHSKKNEMLASDEFKLFGSSVAHLERLAQFLMHALQEFGKASMPLVIAALHESGERYLVMGISANSLPLIKSKSPEAPKNIFGLAFQATAQDTNANCKMDNFDTSVVELNKEDLSSFMVKLQTVIIEFS